MVTASLLSDVTSVRNATIWRTREGLTGVPSDIPDYATAVHMSGILSHHYDQMTSHICLNALCCYYMKILSLRLNLEPSKDLDSYWNLILVITLFLNLGKEHSLV